MNARSLVNKTTELQALASDLDLLAITETWLKPHILDCELLPGLNFTIHRRDRENRSGGGVMLAVKNTIQSLRRIDLEGNAEILLCELRPDARRKILAVVFYRPPLWTPLKVRSTEETASTCAKSKNQQVPIPQSQEILKKILKK